MKDTLIDVKGSIKLHMRTLCKIYFLTFGFFQGFSHKHAATRRTNIVDLS